MEETQAIVPCRKFEGYAEWVKGTLHLPGGQWMIHSYGSLLRLWDLTNGEQIGEDWQDGESRVIAIALSPDGKKVCCGSGDGAVRIWNIDTGKAITKWTEHTDIVSSLCWSRDGGRVVSGSYDLTTKVWDVESGVAILSIETGVSCVEAVIFSPDTTMIATGGRGHIQFLNIWDSTTGNLVANLKEYRPARALRMNCLAWTAEGNMLISGAWDGSIMTWDTTTWQPISVLQGHTATVMDIAISPNGRILASTSWDNTARLWNLEDGQPISSPLQHASAVTSTSFSTDGQLVHTASGFSDKNAYTWDVSAILRGAGLDELLSNTDVSSAIPHSYLGTQHIAIQDGVSDKSFLDVRDTLIKLHIVFEPEHFRMMLQDSNSKIPIRYLRVFLMTPQITMMYAVNGFHRVSSDFR